MTQLFDAKDDGDSIILSSVHSCKGLEAETVYILRPELMPHPKATRPEDTEQENNIRYVALTRSKNKIVFAHEHYTEPKQDDSAGNAQSTGDAAGAGNAHGARREYSPTLDSPAFGPSFDGDLFSSWKDHVRALLKEAHERTPFDELEVIEKIEAALAAL
jgi:ATP-dependent exoDNAse (exonuclease V) beta subunit